MPHIVLVSQYRASYDKTMRLFLLFSAVSMLFGQEVPDGLLGRWRTTVITKGGIGALYEFKTGGVVLIRPAAIAPGTYKLEGADILLPPLMEGGPPNRLTMIFESASRIKFYKGKDLSMELSRVGKAPAGKQTVQGEWVGTREMDGQKMEMRMFYYPGGRSMFLLPLQTQQAKYTISNGRMTLILPDGKTTEGPFTLSGGALSIPSIRAGNSTKLARY
jgi:hypothetical protein